MCSREHCRACVDPGNDRVGRVEGAIPAGADAGIQQPATKILKQQWSQRAITSGLER
jgi:hypothetical protein